MMAKRWMLAASVVALVMSVASAQAQNDVPPEMAKFGYAD
jgi:hypothetical protein